jgi:hypothetical protein
MFEGTKALIIFSLNTFPSQSCQSMSSRITRTINKHTQNDQNSFEQKTSVLPLGHLLDGHNVTTAPTLEDDHGISFQN